MHVLREYDHLGCMFFLTQDTRWNFDTKFVAKCDDTECPLNLFWTGCRKFKLDGRGKKTSLNL